MSNLTVSSKVDTFMQATTSEGMQKAVLDTSAAIAMPIVIAFKNVTVLTTGSPADVASITLPSWLTRWRALVGNVHVCVAESASGTLAGANFSAWTAANGGGNGVCSIFLGPSSTSVIVAVSAASTGFVPQTASTIYLRQTTDSANAGVISVYLTIIPCL